jgi:hypothetical protein
VLAPVGIFEIRHFVNAVTGLLGIIGCWKLGSLLGGPKAGFFSAFFLSLTPTYYGHMFNNPKDIPFAVMFLFSLYYIVLFYRNLPQPTKILTAKLAVTLGLTLGIRVGGVLLYGYLVLVVAIWVVRYHLSRPHPLTRTAPYLTLHLGLLLLVVFIVSWTVMLLWWPWAQVSPISHPLEAIEAASHFPHAGRLLFNGRIYSSNDLPWTYLPVWLIISLPEFYFIFMTIGIILILYSLLPSKRTHVHSGSGIGDGVTIGVLTLALIGPILAVVTIRPILYDGMRHFLFLLPVLAVLSGAAFSKFLHLKINSLVQRVTVGVIALSMGLTAYDMVDLHPYQTIYFNRLVAGGLPAAYSRFETDYWGSSYKEGALWLLKSHHAASANAIKVGVNCGHPTQIGYYLNKDRYIDRARQLIKWVRVDPEARKMPPRKKHEGALFEVVSKPEDADIVMSTTRHQCHTTVEGEVLHTVRRKNVPILYVISPTQKG